MKKALVVGIDHYSSPNDLSGCVNDAVEMASILESNGDGSPNFDVRRIISSEESVTSYTVDVAIRELFSGDADVALLFFAGHGILDADTNSGYLVTQDGRAPNWGINLSGVLEQANRANPRIKSTVIIIDSCSSGFAGEVSGLNSSGKISVIGTGVTILTACHREGFASEEAGHGSFTGILLDGLSGAASDVIGRVTPAALYAHVDQTLGAWEQRPVYKANVLHFISLREVPPKVPKDVLRRLPKYFPTPSAEFRLDPSFEPDRGEETERLKHIPVNEENVRIYRELQICNRHGLVLPTMHEHIWHSAVFSGGCRLTATGAHYRRLAEKRKI
jgi:hypothetical protein